MLKKEMIDYVIRLQNLGRILLPDCPKMYICGSPPAVLSRNYFARKIPHVPDTLTPTFFLDNIITHDKSESRIVLADKIVLHKNKETLQNRDKDSVEEYITETLQRMQSEIPDWYTFCIECIRWIAFVAKRSVLIEEWSSCTVDEKKVVLEFLHHISPKEMPVDIACCPICGGIHTGSFSLIGNNIFAQCGILSIEELAEDGAFRLKKGYLQFVPVLLHKGSVLVNSAFYKKNEEIIRAFSWENRFSVIAGSSKQEYLLDSVKQLFPKSANGKLILSVNRADNWNILCDSFGRSACALVLMRHLLKTVGDYKTADVLREEAKKTYHMNIEDIGEGRYALSETVLRYIH